MTIVQSRYPQPDALAFNISGGSNMTLKQGVMLCCGAASLEGFSNTSFRDFQDKADWLSFLHQNAHIRNVIFIVNDTQKANSQAFKLLVEIGAKQIDEWPNWNHGGNHNVYMYRVDTAGAIGKYLTKDGRPISQAEHDELVKAETAAKLAAIMADRKAKGLSAVVPVTDPKIGELVQATIPDQPWHHWDAERRSRVLDGHTYRIRTVYYHNMPEASYVIVRNAEKDAGVDIYLPWTCLTYALPEVAKAVAPATKPKARKVVDHAIHF
jgi:hypothetical protein